MTVLCMDLTHQNVESKPIALSSPSYPILQNLALFRTWGLWNNEKKLIVCFLLRVHLFFITIWQLNFDSILSALFEFPKLVMGLRSFVATVMPFLYTFYILCILCILCTVLYKALLIYKMFWREGLYGWGVGGVQVRYGYFTYLWGREWGGGGRGTMPLVKDIARI
jgi:hypothetical protein